MFEVGAGSGSGPALSAVGGPGDLTAGGQPRVRRTSRGGSDNSDNNRDNLPRGVYGVSVKHNSLEQPSSDGDDYDSDDVSQGSYFCILFVIIGFKGYAHSGEKKFCFYMSIPE